MTAKSRTAIAAEIITNVKSNGVPSITRAINVRDLLNDVNDSVLNILTDKNNADGYLGLDSSGIPDLSMVVTPGDIQILSGKGISLLTNTLSGSDAQFASALNNNVFNYTFPINTYLSSYDSTLVVSPEAWQYYYLTRMTGPTFVSNPLGPSIEFTLIKFRFADDGSPRAITWDSVYSGNEIALPSTTIVGSVVEVWMEYDPNMSRISCVYVNSASGGGSSYTGDGSTISISGSNVVSIDAGYVGQTSIITVGTITTGVWSGTAIGPTKGGTGLSTYTTGDIIYGSASNVLSKRSIGSSGQVLTVSGGVPTWATPSSGGVTSVSGTSGRISVDNSTPAVPVVDIDAAYVGQTSIVTVGTIGTGAWRGNPVGAAWGGTGVANNGANTLTYSGNFGLTLTLTATTSVTLPTSGTLSTLAGSESFTNKTLGSGTKILLGSDATGDIYYNSGSGTTARLAAGAAGTFPRYAGTGTAPTVSTLVLPNAITAGQLVYGTATNTFGSTTMLTFLNNDLRLTGAAGIISSISISPASSPFDVGQLNFLAGNTTTGGIYANQTTGEFRIGGFLSGYFPTIYSANAKVAAWDTSGVLTQEQNAIFKQSMYIGGSSTPIEKLEVAGNVVLRHLNGGSSAPTIAAGAGAGTSPTISISGTDLAGYVTVTTGTLPTLSAIVATVTFNATYGAAAKTALLTPANLATAALSGIGMVYIDQAGITATTFDLTAGATALTAATTYKWYYTVIK